MDDFKHKRNGNGETEMVDKIASVTEFTREQFFTPFVKYLHETQGFVVMEEKKPDFIRFNVIPVVKKGTIELRPAGKGFDIYVDMSFSFMYKFGGGLMIKGNVINLILKAVSRAKSELASSTPATPSTNVKYCVKCGSMMPSDAAYCPKCGQKQP